MRRIGQILTSGQVFARPRESRGCKDVEFSFCLYSEIVKFQTDRLSNFWFA